MTWRDRVIWTEGMFLQPQHFQQHDRHWEHQWRQRLQQAVAYAWGFTALSLDEASLTLGKVGLASAQGLLADERMAQLYLGNH